MSVDYLKEFIGYLKALIILTLATLIGLIGWLVANIGRLDASMITLGVIATLCLLLFSAILNHKIINDIKSLKDI